MSVVDDLKLTGKVALVTGGGRGIGQAVAKMYAEGGAKVLVCDIDEAPANETLEIIKGLGGEGAICTGSVAKKEDVEKMVKTALDKLGGLDAMACVAGITRDGMAHKMSLEDWDFILDVNLKGTFLCNQAALGAMRDQAKAEGKQPNPRRIVNVSSVAGLFGNKGQANYSSAKAGIIGLTKTIATEGLMFNVGVNCVAPGFIDTRLTKEKKDGTNIGIPAQDRQMAMMYMNAMGIKIGAPEDIARIVYFLSTPACGYMTGQTLNVSGGFRM